MRSRNASSSDRTGRRVRIGLAFVVLMVAIRAVAIDANTPAVTPVALSLDALLSAFKQMQGLDARFEEEKTLALLAVPLRSSGRLYFAAPSSLLRRVEEPRPQDILLVEDRVRISDASSEQIIDLAGRPEVEPLVKSILWIFTGDRAALEAAYRIDYQASDDAGDARWLIGLTPRKAPLSDLLRELRIAGRGLAADRLELIETSGDRTITSISEVNPERVFEPEERRALFGFERP